MASFKEIKERINSIRTTRQITSAMKMVSAAKLSKAQRVITNMLPYSRALNDIFRRVVGSAEDLELPLMQQREVRRVAIVAFSSDTSLAGAFNSNVIKELRHTLDKYAALGKQNIVLYTIGKKVYESVSKAGYAELHNYADLATKPNYEKAAEIAMELIDRFAKGEVDKVELIYHHFHSAGSQKLTREDLLPMTLPEAEKPAAGELQVVPDYIFEPSEEAILRELLPKSFRLKLYASLLDSNTSEHAARMVAMQTATDNADNLLGDLMVLYNKSRQQAITNELLDIMGGQR